MPAPELDLHGHHWINTVGHSAGVVVFGQLGWLLYRDARRSGQAVRVLPLLSTGLALAFDLFLLFALGFREQNAFVANACAALAFAALSLLPAVLLDINLQGNARGLRLAGYLLAAVCAGLHVFEIAVENAKVHAAALLTLSIGFAVLALVGLFEQRRRPRSPTAASVCVILLALSFSHFLSSAQETSFWAELVLHHAGIPVALIVVLEEYRFLLLDAFLRLLTSGALAAATVAGLWSASPWLADQFRIAADSPFSQGLLFVLGAAALLVFAMLRERAQDWLTHSVFLRPDPARIEEEIRRLEGPEEAILEAAARLISAYFRAESWRWSEKEQPGYEARVRLRFLKGDSRYLQLGGRRFLSEDLDTLEKFGALAAREVDRARTRELERLMLAAELRALQSQIHPHFLFNALNALYGSIPRAASDARRLVLSLSEIFRYFLTSSKPTVRLEEELRIVEAYLEIEKARLGARLSAKLEIAPDCLQLPVPVLSVEPLVENAVKHGVAAMPGPGEVRVSAHRENDILRVSIEDTGPGFSPEERMAVAGPGASNRVGLENVRRRISLHYGDTARLSFERLPSGMRVLLDLPVGEAKESAQGAEMAARGNLL
jgi:signal transduction histidine kinase